MRGQLAKPLNIALNWLLPPVCPATGQDVDVHGTVAPDYWASLRFIRQPFCNACALPFPHDIGGEGSHILCAACIDNPPSFRTGRAALIYDDASRSLILRFKHGDQLQAIRTLAPWLRDAGADVLAGCDVIMPVPLHRWRLLKRRYNQSALLAHRLGKRGGKAVALDGLVRARATPPQAARKRAERIENVRGAFKVKGSVAGKTVLLIDDVMTTGATLNACAEALIKAGAAAVDVLCVARVVRDL